MSTPAEQTFEQKVNTAVDSMTQDDKGNWQLPADSELSEEVKYTAVVEKRRRDTQSEYGRNLQTLKSTQAENDKLTTGWAADVASKLTDDQAAELTALKAEDPDAWRLKVNEYEQANGTAFKEKRATISSDAKKETELESRERVLEEFTTANPDLDLSDEVIANDLPPRYLKKLEAGESTFAEFLAEAKHYLTANKVVAGTKAPGDISLSKAAGSSTPEESAVEKNIVNSYTNETY